MLQVSRCCLHYIDRIYYLSLVMSLARQDVATGNDNNCFMQVVRASIFIT
jgi:hypothetical protein